MSLYNQWFATYIVYFITPLSKVGAADLAAAQEDLVLFSASSPNHAREKAEAYARDIAEFGASFVDGDIDKLAGIGMDALQPLLSLRQGVPEAECHDLAEHVNQYQAFDFAGISRIAHVGSVLEHGTVVDVTMIRQQADKVILPDRYTLNAYNPIGPAVAPDRKMAEKLDLYEKHHWYLAEQVFVDPSPTSLQVCYCHRLVLINTPSPDDAFVAAIDEGTGISSRPADGTYLPPFGFKFEGLGELYVITNEIGEDGCEIRSRIIERQRQDLLRAVNEGTGLN